jgi:hypothetical protein
MKQYTMKLAILSMAAIAAFAGILAIGFTPAQATVMAPSLKAYIGSSMTPVHCIATGYVRVLYSKHIKPSAAVKIAATQEGRF